MLAAFTGLIAGFVHVLSGPDHLAAVAPLAVKAHRSAWRSGLRWGLGHSAGVAVVGLLALAFRKVLPLEALSGWSERLVGVLLLGVGVWALRQALRVQVHLHAHVHDGEPHDHLHFHAARHGHSPEAGPVSAHQHGHAAFGIGTLHGLAGSSHFLGILPTLGFVHLTDSLAYLFAFAAGTVVAMGGFASALAVVARWFATDHLRLYRGLMFASSMVAFVVGTTWLVTER